MDSQLSGADSGFVVPKLYNWGEEILRKNTTKERGQKILYFLQIL